MARQDGDIERGSGSGDLSVAAAAEVPAEPDAGKTWVRIGEYSDEFTGSDPLPDGAPEGTRFTTAAAPTGKGTFTYGYAEVRAKAIAGKVTSAFWLNHVTSVYLSEIDVIELHNRTYAVDWRKEEISFYLDGVKVRTIKNTSWHDPLSISLTAAIQPWNGEPATAEELEAVDPSLIDYVRVYQQRPAD